MRRFEIKRHKAPKPLDEPRTGPILFVRQKAPWVKDTPPPQAERVKEKKESVRGLVTSRGIRYGLPCAEGLRELVHTAKGSLRDTGEIIENTHTETYREVVRWPNKVVGLEESFFPHPGEWRFDGLDVPLDKIDVRSYTQFLSHRARVEPTCLSAWEKRIGALPREVGERYKARLLTPRDWGSHFKNVLHRSLMVRSITTDEPCRCCGHAREDLRHFGRCDKAAQVFEDFQSLTETPNIPDDKWDRFTLFALLPSGKMPDIWVDLHLLLWKQLTALLVRIELEGDKFTTQQVWGPAWARLQQKILALRHRVDETLRRSESRGEEPPDVSKRTRWVEPLASFDKAGHFKWNDKLVAELDKLGKAPNSS